MFRRIVYGLLYRAISFSIADMPRMTPGAVFEMSRFLKSRDDPRVFEWGSGVSSLWFAKRCGELITIEHNPEWHRWVCPQFEKRDILNAKCILSPPLSRELVNAIDWDKDWRYFERLGQRPRKPEYRDYMASIDTYPVGYFDLISIDGRERVGCLMHAIDKLADSGLLVLDDANRMHYAAFYQVLKGWYIKEYPFGGRHTTIFRRLKG